MDIVERVVVAVVMLMCLYLFWMWFCFGSCVKRWQKTRNPRERRMYVGTRARPSFTQPEPTIFVSPSNLPPPPKYEAMAPPSYEEVVGIHYPQFQQPITTPIVNALAQNASHVTNSHATISNAPISNNTTNVSADPSTVITVTANERRTSVTVASS